MQEQLYNLGIKVIIQNKLDEVLLLKHAKGYWDFPGGRVQQNEDPMMALYREVKEETGLVNLVDIKPDKMILTNFSIASHGLILWYHTCKLDAEEQVILSSEHSEFRWVNPSEVRIITKLDENIASHIFKG
jgi:8-oxo-dGTP pyrophosphatase MutT (NUDIX family)